MLDLLRRHSQSWLIKVLFGAIILVFIFFGVYTFSGRQGGGGGVLATVGDQHILVNAFRMQFEEARRQIQSQNPSITQEEIEQYKKQFFEGMVARLLLFTQADKLGVAVSETELRADIAGTPVFQKDGVFDPALYERLIKTRFTSAHDYEHSRRQDLLYDRMVDYATLPAYQSVDSVRSTYNFVRQKAVVDYIPFMTADFASQVSVAPDEIQKTYDANKAAYKLPTMIKIEYLAVTPAALADPKSVTDAEAKAYYDANPDKFKHDAMIEARYILARLPRDAKDDQIKAAEKRLSDLADHLRKGEPLTKVLALPGNPPVAGNDLGWVPKGVLPEVDDMAFALKKGAISAPTRISSGVILIQAVDRKDPGIVSFDEAKDDIKKELATSKASAMIDKTTKPMLEELIGGAQLSKLAQGIGLTVKTTDFFSREDIPQDLSLDKATVEQLFSLAPGKPLQQVVDAEPDGQALVKVLEVKPEHIPAFAEVADTIKKNLIEQKSAALAQAKAKEVADQLATPEGQTKVAGQFAAQIKTSDPFGRMGAIAGLGRAPQLSQAAFAAKAPGWLGAFPVPGGVVVARLNKWILPDDSEWQADQAKFMQQAQELQQISMYQSYLGALREHTPVKILDPQVLTPPPASKETE